MVQELKEMPIVGGKCYRPTQQKDLAGGGPGGAVQGAGSGPAGPAGKSVSRPDRTVARCGGARGAWPHRAPLWIDTEKH
ncbi:ATP-dependent helicase brm [Frankliniella fusca]|uniref:ATP-dependent helicase brm n=1 Tax=Frankliniella fusca TaxID=407009 RepID=A0AAE1HII7_9NEOP|nr:ATP-dependent helicase brm [Frankliniella fusca]